MPRPTPPVGTPTIAVFGWRGFIHRFSFPIDSRRSLRKGAYLSATGEQLRIKLKSQKGSLRMLIVDHVERPSAD